MLMTLRSLGGRVREDDTWSCPGHQVFGLLTWVSLPASAFCAEDVALWPYTTGLLVKWVSSLGSLHWPAGGLDLCGTAYFGRALGW